MLRNHPNLGFPRKVVACYLFFCLVAVTWLTVGVWFTTHEVLSEHSVETSLATVGKASAELEIAYLKDGPDALPSKLADIHAQGKFSYCSIVGTDATYLAHSNPTQIGTTAIDPVGSRLRWGDVTGIRYYNEKGRPLREFHVPLSVKSEPIGTLRLGMAEPNVLPTLGKVAGYAPLSVLVPLALIFCGGWVLTRMTRPVATIDEQLRQVAMLPPGSEISPKPVAARDGSTLGWNRLIDTLESLRKQSGNEGLSHRLAEAVTARKQNEMVDILQSLSDGIAVTDPEGRITFANRAINVLLGVEEEEHPLVGNEIAQILTHESPELAECELFSSAASHRPVISEMHRATGKSDRRLRVCRQPIEGERLKGQLWSLRDVTQQKLADKMRDQFIDTATHELRTPLSNIKAYAEMLATSDKIEVEQQKEFCNIINSEVTRLARFVDDLLSISSMEVGSLSAERQNTEIARLFEDVLIKVKPLMQQKDIQFEVRLPEKMGELKLDKEKLVAVLVNLIGNAAKYTPTGGHVALKVKLDDTALQIAVEDTGVGIAPDELPMVFEKFFRSNDARVQAETGTGLGLSLAREVVRMHGGDITVESKLDEGSTFLVTIPVER